MKTLVCCLFVIANISNNGKASLESFAPTNSNVLLEDTTKNSGKIIKNMIILIWLIIHANITSCDILKFFIKVWYELLNVLVSDYIKT